MSNSFYSEEELEQIGFKSIGKNVKISKKTSIYNASKMVIEITYASMIFVFFLEE